ncbi:hypothetical protein GCM10011613_33830 [Cellvibrio zantedeschiae]|uniref:Anti-sigma K factor RskA C-terminal domain-containing protein n=1 Tax=Cellvibrio zantedeschiae TaxID=1237077 RepID=A0ABQ3BE07_9GAMM|nr:anti-sigma factor [Cellvibrio zantedeschiae]GGY86043.1 hypothetical protein GCM10011613_33830 [Cellvibrio zantedeschiae]
MNDKTARDTELDQLAFDYVTGVMRGEERKVFAEQLARDSELQSRVNFWEEELIAMSDIHEERPTSPETWKAIEKQLTNSATESRKPWWQISWLPAASVAFSLLLLCGVLLLPTHKSAQPNSDYVAVLADEKGAPLLTALTAANAKTLWLKWETINVSPEKNLQLWAVSRNDGQIRSLAVFTKGGDAQLALTDTHMHLIRDAAYLWLTEEEAGGSAIDEPSDKILAKGACVFLDKTTKIL